MGTETGFYISYNGGKNWSACQLNLPGGGHHGPYDPPGDLVASTQGRAFWIFDDLSLFRQYDAAAKGFQLLRPEDAVRVSGFSPMDGPANDSEETFITIWHQRTNRCGVLLCAPGKSRFRCQPHPADQRRQGAWCTPIHQRRIKICFISWRTQS